MYLSVIHSCHNSRKGNMLVLSQTDKRESNKVNDVFSSGKVFWISFFKSMSSLRNMDLRKTML